MTRASLPQNVTTSVSFHDIVESPPALGPAERGRVVFISSDACGHRFFHFFFVFVFLAHSVGRLQRVFLTDKLVRLI